LLPVERAGLDGAAVVVRHELVAPRAAADPHALVRKCGGAGLVAGRDQVARPAVERDRKLGAGKARARNNRLEIARQKSLRLAQGLAQTPDQGTCKQMRRRREWFPCAGERRAREWPRRLATATRGYPDAKAANWGFICFVEPQNCGSDPAKVEKAEAPANTH